jgi:hypothetical protein
MAMLRYFWFFGLGISALLWQLGDPGQIHARPFRGGFRPGVRPMFNPAFRGGFMPGVRPMPMFRFDPRFQGGRFDHRFDRFENRFENRFPGEMFDPRFPDPR